MNLLHQSRLHASQESRVRWSSHANYLNTDADPNNFQSHFSSVEKAKLSSEMAGKNAYFTNTSKRPLPLRGIDLFRNKGKLYSQELCSRSNYSSLKSTFPSQRLSSNHKVSVSLAEVFRNSHKKQRRESSDEERPIFEEPSIKMQKLRESVHQKHPFYFKDLNPYNKNSAQKPFSSPAKGALKYYFLVSKARQENQRKKNLSTQKDEIKSKSTPRKKIFRIPASYKFQGTHQLKGTSFQKKKKLPPEEFFQMSKHEFPHPTERSCCKSKQRSEQFRTILISEQMEKIYSNQTLREYLTTKELQELLRGYDVAHIDPKRWTLLAADEVYRRIRNRYESRADSPSR